MRCDERADDVQGVVDKVLVVSRAELGRCDCQDLDLLMMTARFSFFPLSSLLSPLHLHLTLPKATHC